MNNKRSFEGLTKALHLTDKLVTRCGHCDHGNYWLLNIQTKKLTWKCNYLVWFRLLAKDLTVSKSLLFSLIHRQAICQTSYFIYIAHLKEFRRLIEWSQVQIQRGLCYLLSRNSSFGRAKDCRGLLGSLMTQEKILNPIF